MHLSRLDLVSAGLVAAACAIAGIAAPARAQRPVLPTHVWDSLAAAVRPGTPLVVTRADGPEARGRLLTIDGQSITLTSASGAPQIVDAAGVLRVRRSDIRPRRVFGIGIPLGMLAGGLAMWGIDSRSSNPEPTQAFLMGAVLIGLPVGALAASVWPVRDLYRAP